MTRVNILLLQTRELPRPWQTKMLRWKSNPNLKNLNFFSIIQRFTGDMKSCTTWIFDRHQSKEIERETKIVGHSQKAGQTRSVHLRSTRYWTNRDAGGPKKPCYQTTDIFCLCLSMTHLFTLHIWNWYCGCKYRKCIYGMRYCYLYTAMSTQQEEVSLSRYSTLAILYQSFIGRWF